MLASSAGLLQELAVIKHEKRPMQIMALSVDSLLIKKMFKVKRISMENNGNKLGFPNLDGNTGASGPIISEVFRSY